MKPLDDSLKTIREEFFKKLTYRDQWNQVKYLKKAWPESVADYIDIVVRRLLKEQRAEMVMELKRMRFATTHHEVATVLAAVDTLITKLERGEEK